MKHGDISAHKNNEIIHFSVVALDELILLVTEVLSKYITKRLEF